MKNTRETTRNIVMIGLFAAILAVLSQVAIPLPTNVPVTLQTFAVALTGYFLGWKKGGCAALVYVLLGAVGVPVFANFKGGVGVITSFTGGFIYGFIAMTIICGLGTRLGSKKITGKLCACSIGIVGLAVDHLLGAVQYAVIAKLSLGTALMTVSVPYLVKDIVSVVAAYLISEELIKRLAKMGYYAGNKPSKAGEVQ